MQWCFLVKEVKIVGCSFYIIHGPSSLVYRIYFVYAYNDKHLVLIHVSPTNSKKKKKHILKEFFENLGLVIPKFPFLDAYISRV
jgi:hypothetical protein